MGLRLRAAALGLLTLAACHAKPRAAADAGGANPARDAAPAVDAASLLEAGPAADALPEPSSAELTTRARHLLEAIRDSNPDLCRDIVFPRNAYMDTRDADDPGKQWDLKFKPEFDKELRRIARRTRGIDRSVFVSFEIGHQIVQVEPKKKDWKVALWHVRNNTLSFTIDGKLHKLDVGEMTAWRGSWYVTRLR